VVNQVVFLDILIIILILQADVKVAILANKQKTATDLFSRLQTAYENLPQYLQQGVLEWNKTSLKIRKWFFRCLCGNFSLCHPWWFI
jgi:hypothetical protein